MDMEAYNGGRMTKEKYTVRWVFRWKLDGILLLGMSVTQLITYELWWTEKVESKKWMNNWAVVLGLFFDCLVAVFLVVFWIVDGKWAKDRGLI